MGPTSKPAAAVTRKWRTPRDARASTGLIGPNAILQMLPVLDVYQGPKWRAHLIAEAGLKTLPDGSRMIPEGDAARLHRHLRQAAPQDAADLAARAGVGTANYILAHRIPAPVQWLLRVLPEIPAADLLSRAIAKHAWTFAGSGAFRVIDPWTFEIRNNPLIAGETSCNCLCHWHAAVFSQLYHRLVTRDCTCSEVTCGAQGADVPCRFEIR